MKKYLVFTAFVMSFGFLKAQENSLHSIVVTPAGIEFKSGEKYVVVESDKPAKETTNQIIKNLRKFHNSKNLKMDTIGDVLVVTDFIPGYTKTDKSSGSAYLLDLLYKISVDVKDGKFRINAPTVNIAANQKYESDAVIVNKGVQFTIDMGFKGKRDVWDNKAKKLFIYDEKDKLVEKSTKDKLERDLSDAIGLIIRQEKSEW